MTEETIYVCENCGEKFDYRGECEQHEKSCTNKRLQYRNNVYRAMDHALAEFGSIIASHEVRINDEVSSYDVYKDMGNIYKFEIDIKLSNGNEVCIYDGCDKDLWLGNFLEKDTIYKSLKREIESRLTLEYEGIIQSDWEDGWRTDKLGDVDLSDIVDRLAGRMVKIAVVDDKSDSERAVS